jgi:hypothetical protein
VGVAGGTGVAVGDGVAVGEGEGVDVAGGAGDEVGVEVASSTASVWGATDKSPNTTNTTTSAIPRKRSTFERE